MTFISYADIVVGLYIFLKTPMSVTEIIQDRTDKREELYVQSKPKDHHTMDDVYRYTPRHPMLPSSPM